MSGVNNQNANHVGLSKNSFRAAMDEEAMGTGASFKPGMPLMDAGTASFIAREAPIDIRRDSGKGQDVGNKPAFTMSINGNARGNNYL